jgi:tetratricopeptide (TPR) repeat protein
VIMHSTSRRLGAAVALVAVFALALTGCEGAKERQARYTRRGEAYIEKGQLEKARVEFRNALQIAPNSPQLRYYNGLVAEKLGNYRDAVGFYTSAVDADKGYVTARVGLAKLLLFAGLSDRALEELVPILTTQANNVEMLTVQASALQQKGNTAAALPVAERAVQLDPNNEGAVATLAGIEMTSNREDDAQKLVEQAVARLPRAVQLRRVLAQIYSRRRDAANVERVLLALIELEPKQRVYRVQLAQLYANTNRVDDAERALRKAVADLPDDEDAKSSLVQLLWAQRGHEVAEAEVRKMIAAAPKDTELRFTLANLYEQGGEMEQAATEYRALIGEKGHDAPGLRARDRLAVLYAGRNDNPGAQKLISEVLEQNPGDNEALGLRAYEELLGGDAEAAIKDLRRVLRDQPNTPGLLSVLARAYVADGEPDLAEESARRAVEIDPADVSSRMGLAQVLLGRGKFLDARAVLTELNKQRPDDVAVLDMLYKSNIAQGHLDAAEEAANELVRLRPQWGMGQVYLGVVAESEGHPDEALADYRRGLELQPHAFEPLNAITRLFERAKRYDEAMKFLDGVIQRDATTAVAPSLKGEVLLAQGGHFDQAEAAFRMAQQRAPRWWDPYRGLAYAMLGNGDPSGAAKVLKDARAHAQLSEAQSLELAGLLTGAGEPEQAMQQYESILKVRPKSQLASAGLAMLLVSYRTDQASYNRALSLVRPLATSTDWRLLDAVGWVHFKNEDVNGALPVLQKAVETAQTQTGAGSEPRGLAELRFHLAMAEIKAGQTDVAEKNLSEAVANDERFFGHDEAKAVLAQLRNRKS